MEIRRKIAVATVMSFALLAITASVLRLPFIFKTMQSYDASWDGMELTLWSEAELTLGIGCTCAPALRAFFTRKTGPALIGRLHTLQDRIEHSFRPVIDGGTGKHGASDSGGLTSDIDVERRESEKTMVETLEKYASSDLEDLGWGKKMSVPAPWEDQKVEIK